MSERLYDIANALDEKAGDEQQVMAWALALRGTTNQIRELVESVAAGYLNSHEACAKIADILGPGGGGIPYTIKDNHGEIVQQGTIPRPKP